MNMLSPNQKPSITSSTHCVDGSIIIATYIRCADLYGPLCDKCAGYQTHMLDNGLCPICGAAVDEESMVCRCSSCSAKLFRCRHDGGFRCIHQEIAGSPKDDII